MGKVYDILDCINLYRYSLGFSSSKGSFFCRCKELPHLIGFGDTHEDAMTELKEIIEVTLTGYSEEGIPLPKPLTISGSILDLEND